MTRLTKLLFPALIGGSLVLHAIVLNAGWQTSSSHAVQFQEMPTVVLVVEEELPPPPTPVEETQPSEEPPAIPEPEEQNLLTSPAADSPPVMEKREVASIPEPAPKPTPKPAPRSSPHPALQKPPTPSKSTPPIQQKPSGAVTLAKPDSARNPPPRYPEFARRNGWQGRVMVTASVDAGGRVRSVSVSKPSGYAVLDQAALQTVKTWKFRPKTIGGVPTESLIEVPVNFSLRK